MSDTLARITELEIALTHQQAASDELSGVLRDQGLRLDRLEALAARLVERLRAAEAARPAGEGPERPPPHW